MACSIKNTHFNQAEHYMHHSNHQDLIARFDDPKRGEWQRPEFVLSQMGNLSGKSIIDIGAGSGYFLRFFLKEKALATAADINDHFINYLEINFPKERFPNLMIKKVLSDDPLMSEGEFDIAFMSNTYHHIDHRVRYLRKIHKGLKPNGIFVTLDYSPQPRDEGSHHGPPLPMRISIKKVKEELKGAGFQELQVFQHEFPYHYLVIAKK
jgi:SAM-dependent methyltransferase